MWKPNASCLSSNLVVIYMGKCNPQVPRLWVNRLPTWIPQDGCCAPDSECFYAQTNQGVLQVNNNGDLLPGLLFVHKHW